MARARKFWLGVGPADQVEEAISRSFALLSHSSEAALEAMLPGDGLTLYAKSQNAYGDDPVEQFEAIGVIGPGTAWTRGRDGGVIRRLQARWLRAGQPASGAAMAPRLDFIKNKTRWRVSLARDRAKMGREDFARIAEAMDLPGFAWQIRNDLGFGFENGDDGAALAELEEAQRLHEMQLRMKAASGPFRTRKT